MIDNVSWGPNDCCGAILLNQWSKSMYRTFSITTYYFSSLVRKERPSTCDQVGGATYTALGVRLFQCRSWEMWVWNQWRSSIVSCAPSRGGGGPLLWPYPPQQPKDDLTGTHSRVSCRVFRPRPKCLLCLGVFVLKNIFFVIMRFQRTPSIFS